MEKLPSTTQDEVSTVFKIAVELCPQAIQVVNFLKNFYIYRPKSAQLFEGLKINLYFEYYEFYVFRLMIFQFAGGYLD